MMHSFLNKRSIVVVLLSFIMQTANCNIVFASTEYRLSKGQTLYVPVYSNIFSAPKKIPHNLATIVSIRNTDMSHPIYVVAADYYNTKGKLLKRYYQQPILLAPLETTEIFIPEEDIAGGTGANFIVKWNSQKEVNAPIVESVMFGSSSFQVG